MACTPGVSLDCGCRNNVVRTLVCICLAKIQLHSALGVPNCPLSHTLRTRLLGHSAASPPQKMHIEALTMLVPTGYTRFMHWACSGMPPTATPRDALQLLAESAAPVTQQRCQHRCYRRRTLDMFPLVCCACVPRYPAPPPRSNEKCAAAFCTRSQPRCSHPDPLKLLQTWQWSRFM